MAQDQPNGEKSKLIEQATGKAELSYSYWAAKSGEYKSTPEAKLLSEEEARRRAQEISRHVEQTGASAWNTAGTFEERGVSMDWVKVTLEEIVKGTEIHAGSVRLEVASVHSCSGEAHQWLVRGRKRAGFELEAELHLRQPGTEAAVGTLRVTQASSDDLDELVVSWKQSKEADVSVKRASIEPAAQKAIISHLEALLERIKAR